MTAWTGNRAPTLGARCHVIDISAWTLLRCVLEELGRRAGLGPRPEAGVAERLRPHSSFKSLAAALRDNVSRYVRPIYKNKLRNLSAVYQARRGSRMSPAACLRCGRPDCEQELFPLALLSGPERHISSCSWTSWINALQNVLAVKLYSLITFKQDDRSSVAPTDMVSRGAPSATIYQIISAVGSCC
jgi:hypothetical protein